MDPVETVAGALPGPLRPGTGPLLDCALTSFDAPGVGAFLGTFALSVNSAGAIAGYYYGALGASLGTHGFLRAPDGAFTTFDAPGGQGTFALTINSAGAIAGYFDELHLHHRGFLRE